MSTPKGTLTTCSRGHQFYKSKERPTCPVCWPGRYKRQKYTQYHKDGSVWAKGRTARGKMDGTWVWFRKDGSKMRAGSFKLGNQVGTWTTYDKTGRVVKVTKFKNK